MGIHEEEPDCPVGAGGAEERGGKVGGGCSQKAEEFRVLARLCHSNTPPEEIMALVENIGGHLETDCVVTEAEHVVADASFKEGSEARLVQAPGSNPTFVVRPLDLNGTSMCVEQGGGAALQLKYLRSGG